MGWLTLLAVLTAVLSSVWLSVERAWRFPRRRPWLALPLVALIVAVTGAVSDDISRRVLANSLLPIGLVWLALLGTACGLWLMRRWVAAAVVSAIFLLDSAAGSHWFGGVLVSTLERRIPVEAQYSTEKLDAVWVLGGGMIRRSDGVGHLGRCGDRVVTGARLYHTGRTPVLIASGHFAEDTRQVWRELGIPDRAIITDQRPVSTSDEIASLVGLRAQHGWKRVGLVSSAWHLPRALRLGVRAGVVLDPIPCDWSGTIPEWTAVEAMPSDIGYYRVQLALWEYLGMLSGR